MQTALVPPAIRPLQPRDLPAALATLERAFGGSPHPEDTTVELSVADAARFYAAFDDDDERPVATAGSFDFTMAVPGSSLPVAGVTWVGVLPTYRRQGLLTALMERQLADLHASGTAVAALWATEGAIYGRFGYGPAAWNVSVTVPRGAAFSAQVELGALRLVDPDPTRLAPVYDAVAARTPGWPRRDPAWWAFRLHDPEHRRKGASPLQCIVTDGGYALYATTSAWDRTVPAGVVHVRELVAADEGARARLWRHLLDLDLVRDVQAWSIAPDDPLVHALLAEPRVSRPEVRDSLWVRLVDVGAALAGRRYACDVDVVLELDDPRCPWNTGRWRLTGGRSGATCTRTEDAAALVASPADVGAAYLGGTSLRARPVEERTSGALAVTSTAFGPVDTAPWCPQVF